MEFEFDKAIDALLRRNGRDRGVAKGSVHGSHLDADTIAAFAENAVPGNTRALYIAHLADCDECRMLLSHSISLKTEYVDRDSPVEPNISALPATSADSWISSLLRKPTIAMAMGAFVLAFSGILGYLVVQNFQNESASQVSMAPNSVLKQDDRSISDSPTDNLAKSANAADSNQNSSFSQPSQTSNAHIAAPERSFEKLKDLDAKAEDRVKSDKTERERDFSIDGESTADSPVSQPSAPPPIPDAMRRQPNENKPVTGVLKESKGDEKLKTGQVRDEEDRLAGVTVPPAAKKAGPIRAASPRKDRTDEQSATGASEMLSSSSTRSTGGKRFDLRSGVWYDIAYQGQKTRNYRRGTTDYKKLDSGLRNIADSIGGTVILMWKGSPYRIQ